MRGRGEEWLDYLARSAREADRCGRVVTNDTNEKGAAEAAPLNGSNRAVRTG
jgi:hypothetical protein